MARPAAAGELSLVQDQSHSSSWKGFFSPSSSAVEGYLPCWSQPKAAIGAACSLGRDRSELQYVSRCPPTLWRLRAKDSIPLIWSLNSSPHLHVKCLGSCEIAEFLFLRLLKIFLFCFFYFALNVCTTGNEVWSHAKCTSMAGCIVDLNLFLWFWAPCKMTCSELNSSVWVCLYCGGPLGLRLSVFINSSLKRLCSFFFFFLQGVVFQWRRLNGIIPKFK